MVVSKALLSADKLVNIFVTLREIVGGALVILGAREGIAAEIIRKRDGGEFELGTRVLGV